MVMVSIVLALVTDPKNQGIGPIDLDLISVQMAGIAQTVIIVRIAYGQAVESVQQMVSTLRFAEGANNSQQQSMGARGTASLRQSLTAVEGNGTFGNIETNQDKPPSNVAENEV
ncbi:hypothetical protein PQX77_021519 [Marasmius sp. AFHP31]|nr:hypothetical protein PQX77_021519 [Marasmius sp. AFHP31]